MFQLQAQFSAVLEVISREVVRQISRVFREQYLHLVAENQALSEKVGTLEAKLTSKVHAEVDASKNTAILSVLKIRPTGQCNADMRW